MQFLEEYQRIVAQAIEEDVFTDHPKELYEPINNVISRGGKRIRPILVLMANEMFGGDYRQALKPALAIEFFHNFTLIHDDIMDEAELRRNQPTIHTLHGVKVGILAGDALIFKSFQFFENLEPNLFYACTQVFIRTGLMLCEGQQHDINFETEKEVSFDDYLKMITYKTAALSAASLEIGALIAGADLKDAENIAHFGKHLGIAFQMMDDYLDVFGDQEQFGKKHAGDIVENKKTVLYLLAKENASIEDRKILESWYSVKTDSKDKIHEVAQIFRRSKADEQTLLLIHEHQERALHYLDKIEVGNDKKKPLIELADFLLERQV